MAPLTMVSVREEVFYPVEIIGDSIMLAAYHHHQFIVAD